MNAEPITIAFAKAIFTSEYVSQLIVEPHTHDAARGMIAQIVRFTTDEQRIHGLVEAALPQSYVGNTLAEVPSLISGALAKGYDKNGAGEKAEKRPFLDFFCEEITLHHDGHGRGIMRVSMGEKGDRSFWITSRDGQALIRRKFYLHNNRALRVAELTDICAMLEARAIYEGTNIKPALRVGHVDGSTFIDLVRDDGAVVKIDQAGWSLTTECPVHFLRSSGQSALPIPTRNGQISKLQRLLHLDDGNWHKLLGFLINGLRYDGPYMCLLIEGDQGSGKSFLAWIIKQVLDPNELSKQKLTDSDRDLMIQALHHWVPVYDNVSGMRGDISDALCTLATGGGFATRKLYTDAEQQIFSFSRAFVINGIADFATRPDLLERAILIRLPELPADGRREEKQMRDDFREMLPDILGTLYDAVAVALRNESSSVATGSLRMADAARWITAAEPGLGLPPGTIVKVIAETQSEVMGERALNDSVVNVLSGMVEAQPIVGTVGAIFGSIGNVRDRYDRSFPPTPAHLSRRLKRLRPAMARLGIHVDFLGHTRTGTQIRIWRDGQEDMLPREIKGPSDEDRY